MSSFGLFFTTRRVERHELSVRVRGEVREDYELWQRLEAADVSAVYFPEMSEAEAMEVEFAYVPALWFA